MFAPIASRGAVGNVKSQCNSSAFNGCVVVGPCAPAVVVVRQRRSAAAAAAAVSSSTYGQRPRGAAAALRSPRPATAHRCSAARVDEQQAAAEPSSEQGSSSSGTPLSGEGFAAEQEQEQYEMEAQAAPPAQLPPRLPADILGEFRAEFVAEMSSSALTLTAVTGVIVYWRGVWSLLDYALGDSPIADAACIAGGLLAVVAVRLSGQKVSDSFF